MSTVEINQPNRTTAATPQTMSLVVQLGNAVCSNNLLANQQSSPLAATAIATTPVKTIAQFPSPDVAISSTEATSQQTQLQAIYKKPIVTNTVPLIPTKVTTNNGVPRVQTLNVQRSVQLSHISSQNKMQVLTNLMVPNKQNYVVNKVGQLRAPNQTTLQLGIGTKQLVPTSVVTRPIVATSLNVINASKITKPPQIINNLPKNYGPRTNIPNKLQTHVISRVITPVTNKTPIKINTPTTMVVQPRNCQLPGIKTLPPQTSPKVVSPSKNNVIRTGIKTIPPQRFSKNVLKSNKFILKNPPRVQPPAKSASPIKYQQFQVVPMQQTPPPQPAPAMTVLRTVASYEDNNVPTNIANTLFSPTVEQSQDYSDEEMISEERPDYSKCLNPVLFDHNYHLPPPDSPPPSPTKLAPTPPSTMTSTETVAEPHRNGILSNLVSTSDSPPSNYLYNSKLVNSKLNLPYQADGNQIQDDDAGSTISSDAGREVEPEGEETETAPEGEGDEDSVTRCICDFEHDDGYMICCDKCFVWQHVDCMFIDRQNIQEEYLCERCEPRRVYRQRARAIQLRKREEILNNGSSSDTSTASSNNSMLNNNIVNKKQRPGMLVQPPLSTPPSIQNRRKEPNRLTSIQNRRARRDLSSNASRKTTVVKRRQERKVQTKRKTKVRRNQENEESQDAWDKSKSSDSTVVQLRQWIEHYEEAVTNHYSPELRSRLVKQNVQNSSSNLNSFHSLVQANANVHKCRTIPQPNLGTKILVSSIYLQANIPIIELRGKYMLASPQSSVVTTPPVGAVNRQQTPGPFLFFYKLPKHNIEVCVDTRTYGNDARFVRRSCKPNSEIRHCIEKGTLHLYLVSLLPIDKNTELTIKHETHSLSGPNPVVTCACGNPSQCTVIPQLAPALSPNKVTAPPVTPSVTTPPSTMMTRRSNGVVQDLVELNPQRKRRGRNTVSTSEPELLSPKEAPPPKPVTPTPPPPVVPETPIVPPVIEPPVPPIVTPPPVVQGPLRRSSQNARIPEKVETPKTDEKESPQQESKEMKDTKKMTREERKMEAIMKAFERLEKQEQRKQESKTRQSHRRDSDVSYDQSKRKKRKGRARTTSTNSGVARRIRLNSTDSYMTSGDESSLTSPPLPTSHHDEPPPRENEVTEPEKVSEAPLSSTEGHAAGLLLALANGGQHTEEQLKSPVRDQDTSSSAGSVQSSPGTPMSSNCLLVAAAVEQITPGFKFPKTKKAIMNEWLNKSPELIQPQPPNMVTPLTRPVELPAPLSVTTTTETKALSTLVQAANICSSPNIHPGGNAKKRWLRQAISEECDSPNSRPDSPHQNVDVTAPPKKRRLARESISSEQSFTPPTTPTRPNQNPTGEEFEDEFYSEEKALIDCLEDSNHKNSVEDEAQHHLNLIKTTQENGMLLRDLEHHDEKNEIILKSNFNLGLPPPSEPPVRLNTNVDPRLRYETPHCLDKVEETLQLLESWAYTPKVNPIPPAKRKLSISEYRQRKQQAPSTKRNDRIDKNQNSNDSSNQSTSNHPNGSDSPRAAFRTRSNSSSSGTSSLSSDDEQKEKETNAALASIDLILEKEKNAPKPKLAAFNSAPTLVERQRENLTARLKREFGLSVPEDEEKKNAEAESTILGQKISFRTNSFLAAPPQEEPPNAIAQGTPSGRTVIIPSISETVLNASCNDIKSYPIPTDPVTPLPPPLPLVVQNGTYKPPGPNISFITPFDNPAYSTNTTYYTGFGTTHDPRLDSSGSYNYVNQIRQTVNEVLEK